MAENLAVAEVKEELALKRAHAEVEEMIRLIRTRRHFYPTQSKAILLVTHARYSPFPSGATSQELHFNCVSKRCRHEYDENTLQADEITAVNILQTAFTTDLPPV